MCLAPTILHLGTSCRLVKFVVCYLSYVLLSYTALLSIGPNNISFNRTGPYSDYFTITIGHLLSVLFQLISISLFGIILLQFSLSISQYDAFFPLASSTIVSLQQLPRTQLIQSISFRISVFCFLVFLFPIVFILPLLFASPLVLFLYSVFFFGYYCNFLFYCTFISLRALDLVNHFDSRLQFFLTFSKPCWNPHENSGKPIKSLLVLSTLYHCFYGLKG